MIVGHLNAGRLTVSHDLLVGAYGQPRLTQQSTSPSVRSGGVATSVGQQQCQ